MKKYRITINPALRASGLGALAGAIAEGGLPDSAEVFYRGRNLLARLPGENMVVKRFGTPGLIKGLVYGWLRTSKCMRAYGNALGLERLGILTPRPAFAVECRGFCSALTRSYYACADLEGWSELRAVEKRPDFGEIVPALAAFILRVHSCHVWMKDMSPGNILFRLTPGGGYEFALVDINRMSFGVTDGRRLFSNFQNLLDTEEGTAAVARAYLALRERSGMPPAHYETEEQARRIYRAFFARKRRWHRFKELIGLGRHHH